MPKDEPLFTCTFCAQPNFTRRGLRAHFCSSRPGQEGESGKLTKEEWLSMVEPPKPQAPLAEETLADALKKPVACLCGWSGTAADVAWEEDGPGDQPLAICPNCESGFTSVPARLFSLSRRQSAIPDTEQSDPKSETAVATGNLSAEVAKPGDAPADVGRIDGIDHPAMEVQVLPSAPSKPGREVTLAVLDVLPPIKPETPEEAERQMAQQLTAQYKLAVGGMREVLIFGAMMIRLEQTVSARGHGGKFGEKGGGLKGWLERNTPDVNRATAYRLKLVTESVSEEYEKIVGAKIAKQYALPDLVVTPAHELPEPARAKQEQLFAFVEGTSQRSWLDRFKPAKSRGGDPDPDDEKKPLTPEEEHKRFLEHARETFINALKAPDDLLHHGFFKAPSITDAEREAAATLYEAFAKELRAFNAIPQKKRTIAANPEVAE